jgi:hypothetical protein
MGKGRQEMGIHIQSRLVPDPSMTDAEFIHQRAENPTKPNIGKVLVQENTVTRIGALAFIRRRLHHHEIAAQRFKSDYEALFGSGVPALDNARPVVDTSKVAHDSGMASKIDRGAGLRAAMDYLGKDARDRVIACIVLCIPCEDAADILPSGEPNRRHVKREVDALLDALDSLSTFWGCRTRAA